MAKFDVDVSASGTCKSIAGKYDLVATIGRGGMADVFLAATKGLMGFNKLVVVKRPRAALAEDLESTSMFADEARLAARLNHPNVVQTYEVVEQDGTYYLVMEYLEGQHLRRVLSTSRSKDVFAPPLVARVISDALAGLHYAHELSDFDGTPLKIVHRDVSPHNVFVTYDGQTKVVDFGVAKAEINATATASGIMKGKASYMAPEQVLGKTVDRRADLYSVGVVLWELLTRSRLFPGEAARAVHKILSESVPPVATVAPHVPQQLQAVVDRVLRRTPSARYASAAEMRCDLEEYLAGLTRPPTRDDVACAMNELFSRERAEFKRRIQLFMTETGCRRAIIDKVLTSTSTLPPTGSDSRSDSGSLSSRADLLDVRVEHDGTERSAVVLGETMGSALRAAVAGPAMPKRPSSPRLVRLGTAAVALAAVSVGAIWMFDGSTPDTTPTISPPVSVSVSSKPEPERRIGIAAIDISTDPPGATVACAGRHMGVTPVAFELPAGSHTLRLVKEGFVPKDYHLTVPAETGGPLFVNTRLQKEADKNSGNRPEAAPTRRTLRRPVSLPPHRAIPPPREPPNPPRQPERTPTSRPPEVKVITDDKQPNIATIP
ncbi:MAG: protein kinase [Polyangiaceae bacterium]|jgi:serine/threonine-protein kinase|nr:protein kinase [Polyangiaceae bacterium]